MREFHSGVAWFAKGHLAPVHFPEDDVCCERCRLYKKYEGRCLWTNEAIPRPKEHIGRECPIERFEFPSEGEAAAAD